MALDALVLTALVGEMGEKLQGARIEKVQQPERDRIILFCRSRGENFRLLINAGAQSGRVQFTEVVMENPSEPPMFCMLLRKHLTGAKIESVEQLPFERLLRFNIISRSEMGDSVDLKLIAELMGSNANIVLVDGNGRIIDCLRRTDFGGDAERRLLPGMIYRYPPKQKKPMLFECTDDEIYEILRNSDTSKPLNKLIMEKFAGLSPLICREIACRCSEKYENLPACLCAFKDSALAGEFTPVMYLDDGNPAEFSFMPLRQYEGVYEQVRCESFCSMLDAYFLKREKAERSKRKSRALMHTVKTNRDRLEKKLALQKQEILRTKDRDTVRKNAELLTANLYRLKKGDSRVSVADYYSEDGSEIIIELDPLKTPQQNAAAMFKEYNKLKAAEAHLAVLIDDGEKRLEYLNSVLSEIELAESERDVSEIRKELAETGCIKKQKGTKQDKVKTRGPLRFVSDDGYEILVGRNNSQNDELTTKTARRTDIWLHTKSVHGSHVIISCDGLTPPDTTLAQAASIAVYYSRGREGGKTAVDYTMVKFVKKPSGSMPGKVIYTDYSTIMAQADEALVSRLIKQK